MKAHFRLSQFLFSHYMNKIHRHQTKRRFLLCIQSTLKFSCFLFHRSNLNQIIRILINLIFTLLYKKERYSAGYTILMYKNANQKSLYQGTFFLYYDIVSNVSKDSIGNKRRETLLCRLNMHR